MTFSSQPACYEIYLHLKGNVLYVHLKKPKQKQIKQQAVYGRMFCTEIALKSDHLKLHCPMHCSQLDQPLWFIVTSMPTESLICFDPLLRLVKGRPIGQKCCWPV